MLKYTQIFYIVIILRIFLFTTTYAQPSCTDSISCHLKIKSNEGYLGVKDVEISYGFEFEQKVITDDKGKFTLCITEAMKKEREIPIKFRIKDTTRICTVRSAIKNRWVTKIKDPTESELQYVTQPSVSPHLWLDFFLSQQ